MYVYILLNFKNYVDICHIFVCTGLPRCVVIQNKMFPFAFLFIFHFSVLLHSRTIWYAKIEFWCNIREVTTSFNTTLQNTIVTWTWIAIVGKSILSIQEGVVYWWNKYFSKWYLYKTNLILRRMSSNENTIVLLCI